MKARLIFQPGESITWDSEADARAVGERLGDVVRVEGCETIFLKAWQFVATFPGDGSPVSGRAHLSSSATTRRSGIQLRAEVPEDEAEGEEADE